MKFLGQVRRYLFLFLALASTVLIVAQASAQEPSSAYNTAVTSLNPVHYFPFNDPYASNPNSVVASDYGSSGGSGAGGGALNFGSGTGNNGTYVTTSGSANTNNFLTNNALGQLSSMGGNNKGIIGSNIGVSVVSQFVNYTSGSAAVISSQDPGFNPNYAYNNTQATNSSSANGGAFYADQRGGVILAATNSSYLGDPTTGAFTIAGWFLGAGQGTTSPNTRFFDDGQGASSTTNQFFQIVGPGSSNAGPNISFEGNVGNFSAGLASWYPSGNANSSSAGGDSNFYNGGQWQFLVVTFSGTDAATRFNDFQVWDRGFLATQGMKPSLGGADGNSNLPGVPKTMFRDFTPSTATASASQVGAGVADLTTWNRVLAYDEIESLYVSAVTPLSGGSTNTGTPVPLTDITNANGLWGNSSVWTTQTLSSGSATGSANQVPTQFGVNQAPYYDVQINNAIGVGGSGLGGYNAASSTLSFRSNMYRLTVSSAGSLSMAPGTALRTYENISLQGPVTMNGDGGTMAPDSWTASSKLDAGQNATIGSSAIITMNAAPATGGTNGVVSNNSGVVVAPVGDTQVNANAIVAEGNLTINSGAQLVVNASSYLQNNTTGPQLFTIAQANSALGDGASGLGRSGVLSGKFNVTLNQPGADPQNRQLFVLYENAGTSGVGTTDSVKVGFAVPGDANLDGHVDINDVGAMGANFNGPGNWRQGDFNNDGVVNVLDINLLRQNYNTAYGAIQPASAYIPQNGPITLFYNKLTGDVDVYGSVPTLDGLTISSSSGALIPANWLGPNGAGDFFTGTNSLIGFNGFLSSDTVSGGTDLGDILPAGLTLPAVQADLTVNYFDQGNNTQFSGSVVPEPSSLALLAAAGAGALWFGRKRRAHRSA